MDWEALFILVTWLGIGLAWWYNRREFYRIREEECDHSKTHTFRLYGFPLPYFGSCVKKCSLCGKQWNLYSYRQTFDEYHDEYNQETRMRQAEYDARKEAWEHEREYHRASRDNDSASAN
jgi:hypothetical protein